MKLTEEDAKRLCRICKLNGFFASYEFDANINAYQVTCHEVGRQNNDARYKAILADILFDLALVRGFKRKERIYLPKYDLNEYLKSQDIDVNVFVKWLDESGMIAKRGTLGRTSAARVNGLVQRCVILHDVCDSESEE